MPGPLFWPLSLRSVAWDHDGDNLIRLAPAGTYHLCFPRGFLRPFRWSAGTRLPVIHPTWQLPAGSGVRAAFGGLADGTCPGCSGPLHRLLNLPVIPAGLGVTTCRALELAACLTCLGRTISTMYFRHGGSGQIIGVAGRPDGLPADVSFGPLPRADVSLAATPPRWRQQDWALSNGLENLNRVGGEPTWIQDPDYPPCPDCGRCMHFLAQLDSLDFADRRTAGRNGDARYGQHHASGPRLRCHRWPGSGVADAERPARRGGHSVRPRPR